MENNNQYYQPQPTRPKQYVNWKEIIIKVLIAALFVVLLVWLFPMPDLNLDPVNDHMFNENVMMMKDAAKNYYSNERLPWKVGEKKTLTLQEMLNKHLLLPIVDGEGNMCNANTSYVEVTKLDTEWQLKAYLDCGTKADYVMEYLGCTDYCQLNECKAIVKEETKQPVVPQKTTPNVPTPKPTVQQPAIYEYEFMRHTGTTWWTAWSNWGVQQTCTSGNCEEKTRELYQARKWSADPVYSYEYQQTLYKGRKYIPNPTYTYEYTKTEYRGVKTSSEPIYQNEYQQTLYRGEKYSSNPVYQYEYKRTLYRGGKYNSAQTTKKEYQRTLVRGRKKIVKIDTSSSSNWSGWSSETSTRQNCPSGTCQEQAIPHTKQVQSGTKKVCHGGYGDWVFVRTAGPSVNAPGSNTNTVKYTKGAYASGGMYYWNRYERKYNSCASATYEPQYTTQTYYTYKYNRLVTNTTQIDNSYYVYTDWILEKDMPSGYEKFDQKTETEWFASDDPLNGWVATGNTKQESNGTAGWTWTDWTTTLPFKDKNVWDKVETKEETIWAASAPDSTWTATGNKKQIGSTDGKYVYSEWMASLPFKDGNVWDKVETKTQTKWATSAPDSTWKATGNKKQVGTTSGKTVYGDWTTTKPSLTDWDKIEQRSSTTWASTTPGTGWQPTGIKKQTGEEGHYIYTDWTTTLPAGYEKTDQKTETTWSELTVLNGWTATGKKKQTNDKGKYIYTDYVIKNQIPSGYEIVNKKIEYSYRYKESNSKTEYTWSTSKTLNGWVATGRSRVKSN